MTESEDTGRNRQYEQLPEAIKRVYSESEWLWRADKRNIEQQETEPETE